MTGNGVEEIPSRKVPLDRVHSKLVKCLEPVCVEDLSALLSQASRDTEKLLIIGGGTRLGWANPADGIESGLSTLGLEGVDIFEPDEGVLHARAGTRVESVRKIALEAGWELPLDPPGPTSTIGGTIASAATGPRAQAFGRVADAILGLEIVGADGRATKCGGRVVKNVTGYDLAKLYCGSFGTLGVLTGAWLRLRPTPASCLAFSAPLPRDPAGFGACRDLARLTSVRALVWVEGENPDAEEGVYFELGGSEVEVMHDLRSVQSGLATTEIPTTKIDSLRDARASNHGSPVVFRARVLGVDCEALTNHVRRTGLAIAADIGLGVVHARGTAASIESLVELREFAKERGGLVTFESLPDDWRRGVDVFGIDSENADLASRIKQRLDPGNILNPGRFGTGC